MLRREFFKVAGVATVGALAAPYVVAQTGEWPLKAVKIVVPYAPGGGGDIIARPWAEKLSQAFG